MADPDALRADWNYPTRIRVGINRIKELPDCCAALGIAAPLLVTDPGLAELPLVGDALQCCRGAGLRAELFNDIKGNPTGAQVDAGARSFREGAHDGVIAFGGGSALDAGKAIAFVAHQSLPLFDFAVPGGSLDGVLDEAIAPVVAVPTTAGTGSEVGRASVITDEAAELKRIIFHPRMLPGQVILDPALTRDLPAALTGATGMDALSHNLEALCSPAFHPFSEGIAQEGIRLVFGNLPAAYDNGGDLVARSRMLVASSMGATAFQKGLGAMHALSHSLGALYDSHHGLLNAILMPYVLEANRREIDEVLARSCRYQGWSSPGFDTFQGEVLALRERLHIPHSLADIIRDDSRAERIGLMATKDTAAGGNPIPFSAPEYTRLFQRAYEGKLS
jgi:alcohol dehydrogenase class IV